jgi:predicted nucleic acid-binding protein
MIMPTKPTVYVETSVISYLTNRPSLDAITLGRQLLTRQWWEERAGAYHCVISEFVIEEVSDGHPEAVARRLAALTGLDLIDGSAAPIEALAQKLISQKTLPPKAKLDALHIATCAFHGIDFLASWNFTHIVNAQHMQRIDDICKASGYQPSRLVTLDQLL